MSNSIKLSVVVITFNEERNLERCLNSVSKVADEIVVVDSYSTDRTKEIALQFNAVFIEHKFEGHIEQKNWAITQAKNPYILSLDSDEEIGETLFKSIQTIKVAGINGSYSLNRLTNYCGHWIRYGGWYPDSKVRIFPKKETIWEGGYVHETLKLPSRINKETLEGDLLHYSYYSIKQHLDQVNYFTDVLAQAYFEKGRKAGFIRILTSPLIKFIGSYFFQFGFLDGYYGFVICTISSHASFLKYVKLHELKKANR